MCPLDEMLLPALVAVLAGAEGFTGIALCGRWLVRDGGRCRVRKWPGSTPGARHLTGRGADWFIGGFC